MLARVTARQEVVQLVRRFATQEEGMTARLDDFTPHGGHAGHLSWCRAAG